jgi:putative cardiolipin synthase
MKLLAADDVTDAALERLRKNIAPRIAKAQEHQFAVDLRNNDAIQRLVAGDWPMHWTSRFRFVADDPAKVVGEGSGLGGSEVLAVLAPAMTNATSRITVISPYFVPGKEGTRFLVERVDQGVGVRVLTNSLAANDVAMVYGGYAKARPDLLDGGVKLWELKPLPGMGPKRSMFGSSGASLHTKALAADSSHVFVGSYNLDPRSTSLNCEQGVFVDEPVIAAQLEALFDEETAGERAWAVTLEGGKLRWTDGKRTYDSSPQATGSQKFQAWLARMLPLDSQL